ncbi:HK97 gp10 family phage protein [Azospirillum brasilense]|uniref:HK97 gp10 family phage protein n=1 Tax=Azospirillum brasilense TaxID=192 RepID=UPI000E69172D|nr:HK97 gp10 family phage protein [Azospirillum brasilense]NUB24713.1 hypothetical protein [Azospirillum brasilense]NUB30683.1 hypothetical protein [Azospirillum brasilense]RIW08293.1 HK97 gp10 family phage protein [Azospirillum brasilense]
MIDASAFLSSIDAVFGHELPDEGKKQQKELLSRIMQGAIEKTPVDTGELKASWTTDGETYIENTAPHAVAVEFGSSRKAPNGMLRATLAELGLD